MLTKPIFYALFCLGLASAQPARRFKNVIMLIPDGCNDSVLSLARWYKKENLAIDGMNRGSMTSYMTNSIINDSAPAGTAFSTGEYTANRFIAVGPSRHDLLSTFNSWELPEAYAPLATILEGARILKKSTGLVSTSRLSHATPADFSAHVDDRGKEDEITLHQVFNRIDVMMGGGGRHLKPGPNCANAKPGGTRDDCIDLEEELLDHGYEMCSTRFELEHIEASAGKKVWCTFAESHMAPDIDRKFIAETEPSIDEMTKKAIDILSQDPAGFFLMVEGSEVDWAGHANDAVWMATDFIAFDNAVKTALEFAEADGDTLVIAAPDHNTGGLTVGTYVYEYTDRSVEFAREPFLNFEMTGGTLLSMIGKPYDEITAEELIDAVKKYWHIDLKTEEAEEIIAYPAKNAGVLRSTPGNNPDLSYALSRRVSELYTIAGWTSHGHTAETIPLYMYGMDAPRQLAANVDVGRMAAEAFGLDLKELTDTLYFDMDATGLEYEVFTTDVTDPHAIIEGYKFPLGHDYYLVGETRIMLPGITVYAPNTDKLYVSQEAIYHVIHN